MPESINSKLKEQYDHDDSGGSLDTNLGDFLDSESASGTSNNTKWRNWAEGTGTSLNTRLFNKHGGSGSFMTRWKNWVAFSSTHSINFDGSNDYLEIADNSELGFADGQAFSVSIWFKTSDATSEMYLFDNRGGGSTTEGFSALLDGNATNYLGYIADGSSSATVTNTTDYHDGNWHHFAFTWDGTDTITSYIDGSSVGTDTQALGEVDGGALYIGKFSGGSSSYFNGQLDEFAIWNAELSASDVTSIYNNGKVIDLSNSTAYAVDRTANLKLWLRCGDKAEPESTTSIARQDFYTDFDGTDDTVKAGSLNDELRNISNLSATAWIYPTHTGTGDTYYSIVNQWDYSSVQNWGIWLHTDGATDSALHWNGGGSASNAVEDATKRIPTNQWTHVACTKDGTAIKLYVNGSEVVSGTDSASSVPDVSGILRIGSQGSSGSDDIYFSGKISNVTTYKTTLDAQTIKQFAKSRFTPMRDNRFSVVDFDGSNDYIDISSSLTPSALTFTIWIATVTDGNYRTFIQCGDLLISKSDGNKVHVNKSGSAGQNSTTSFVANEWTHIAVTADSSGTKVYRNGVLDLNGSAIAFTAGDILIGKYSGGQLTSGSISSVAFYSSVKSADEIYAIYQQGITYDESSLSGLVGYWRMGDDTSKAYPTIADSSSNSNDGTITNGASDDIVQQMVAGYDMGAFESTGEELGGELVDTNARTFEGTSTYGWAVYGNNTITNDSNTLKITRVDNNQGAYLYLRDATDLTTNLTVGTTYLLSADSLTTDSSLDYTIRVNGGGGSGDNVTYSGLTNTSFVTKTFEFTANSVDNAFLVLEDLSGSQVVKVDNLSLKEVLQSADLSDTYPLLVDVNNPVISQDLQTGNWNQGDMQSDGITWGDYVSANGFRGKNDTSGEGDNDNAYGDEISFTAGKTYKMSFTNTINSGSMGSVLVGVTSGTDGNADNIMAYSLISSTGNYSYTFTPSSTVTRRPSFRFVVNGTYDFTISNFEIIEYKGNTGTMTNQASSDLVYSSVLPDQSFLTGVNSAYNYIDLDGSNEYIDTGTGLGTSLGDNYAGSLSISTWFKADSSSAQGIINIGTSFSNDQGKVKIYSDSSYLRFWLNGTAWRREYSFTDTSSWHHLLCVYDISGASDSKMYVDGSAVGAIDGTDNAFPSASDMDLNGTKVIIGGVYSSSYVFNGKIGQTAIWNKALSSTEVSAIYTLGRHGNLLDSYADNLKGYWAMSSLDASTGLSDVGNGTIYDRSGNSNHGTGTNTESADLKSSPNAQPEGYSKGDTNRSTTTP
jgi:hypothetical protein